MKALIWSTFLGYFWCWIKSIWKWGNCPCDVIERWVSESQSWADSSNYWKTQEFDWEVKYFIFSLTQRYSHWNYKNMSFSKDLSRYHKEAPLNRFFLALLFYFALAFFVAFVIPIGLTLVLLYFNGIPNYGFIEITCLGTFPWNLCLHCYYS